MDSSMTLRYPVPPPTSNNLHASQKARIQRSARKIGELMGTTPQLMETPIKLLPFGARTHSPAPSTSSTSSSSAASIKSSRRQGSIFHLSSAASSVTSLALPYSSSSSTLDLPATEKLPGRRSNDVNRPTPLVLHFNPVPLSPSDPRMAAFPPTPTPTSEAFSPITPTFDVSFTEKRNADARRKKMAKLTRTLGETVPAELVFDAPASTCRPRVPSTSGRHIRNRNRRSMSLSGAPQPMWSTGATNAQAGWVGEWNRHDIRDVQKQLRGLKAR